MKLSRYFHTLRAKDREYFESLNSGNGKNAFKLYLKHAWQSFIGGPDSWRETTYIISHNPDQSFKLLRIVMIAFVSYAFLLVVMSLYVLFSLQGRPQTTQLWDFDLPGNYLYDDQKILIAGGVARTGLNVHTDDSSKVFEEGEYAGVEFDAEKQLLTMDTEGMLRGEAFYESRLHDASAPGAEWDSIELTVNRPINIPLPGDNGADEGFAEGVVSMHDNTLLMGFEQKETDGVDHYFSDRSGSGNTALTVGTGSVVGGIWGNAAEFDGNNDYLKVFPYKEFPLDEITVMFWVRTLESDNAIVSYASESDTSDFVIFDPSNLQITISGRKIETDVSVNDGQWHHVAVTWNSASGDLNLAKDGFPAFSKKFEQGALFGLDGSFVVGERQDELGGFFDESQSFRGQLDELAVFNREVELIDINQMFRRGAHKIRLQIRTCDESYCDGSEYSGPDGVDSWYQLGEEQELIKLDNLGLTGRYLQYRLQFITLDSGLSAGIKQVVIRPDHYVASRPVIRNRFAVPFEQLEEFEAEGDISMQISPEGTIWYYFDGAKWSSALNDTMVSGASDIAANISDFDTGLDGAFFFRAFMEGGLHQQAELDFIRIRFDSEKAQTLIPGYPDPDVPDDAYTSAFGVRLLFALVLGVILTDLIGYAVWRYHFTEVVPPFVVHDHAVVPDSDHPLVGRQKIASKVTNVMLDRSSFMLLAGVTLTIIVLACLELLLQLF